MLRGLRTTSDMEYEFTMSLTNLALDNEIETIFLMWKGDAPRPLLVWPTRTGTWRLVTPCCSKRVIMSAWKPNP